ncbi:MULTISPECIES: DUF1993 domain-containing protein [Rhizobium]|uniref:DUF1993 domain-containing protein n=1 Tax=Rhizobium rhododendri TaxID=2506430 RepID=A0ABY8IFW1_9HYPH|nr:MULTISPECIES: DUF1993 domain-containing protein [Rhizobium]MBZ5760675.1 DUF1993 domain-containing protein [Rhizobium sp. VS19-DR96]MBZ5765541.1 DUF1993 domain-containing protein [Rhizobium sp. VS19-DR129.2]MBZ5774460.1 DUF1993 domain-containing protein [Rhizobium sp. VS19-DRK62.2]MBZ5784510.1 DUF1993 domain-containing protein [Rhizobium sp. VS19-DR121]MBZ5801122.1 DUF1993 domain-containing protein [Rhizobium sp. VS19-DR181]
MALSMYRMSIPVFQRGLATLTTYLDKADSYATETGKDPATLVEARLAPDMLPLSGQIQRASDTAKLTVSRLSGIEAPRFEDTETTIAELRARVEKTTAFLSSVAADALEGSETREVTISPGGVATTFRGDDYLASFALPNFYFHVAMAHAILRNQGLIIGKRDYLGPQG